MAATPSFTVVPRHRLSYLARIWDGAAQRQTCGAPCWVGSPRSTAHPTNWISFPGLVSLLGCQVWPGLHSLGALVLCW